MLPPLMLPALSGLTPAYTTALGAAYLGDSLALIRALPDRSIDLAMTSPPFPLLRPKEYGNRSEGEYVAWLGEFLAALHPKLRDRGSLVLDLGGTYRRGVPARSLYPWRVLTHAADDLGYHLAQDFLWFNPSRLPSPIEWVNKRKIRVKDSVDVVWWLSPAERPRVHVPFGGDTLLKIANSGAGSRYLNDCRRLGVKAHPARFPEALPRHFVQHLTREGDVVLDFFAGSNTTGRVAEHLGRRWLGFEREPHYLAASTFRFLEGQEENALRAAHAAVLAAAPLHLTGT